MLCLCALCEPRLPALAALQWRAGLREAESVVSYGRFLWPKDHQSDRGRNGTWLRVLGIREALELNPEPLNPEP